MGSLINEVNKLRAQSAQKIDENPPVSKPQQAVKTVDIKDIALPKSGYNLKDEFVKEKRKNGLGEKFYDFLKNTTNFGLSSKRIEKNINLCQEGKLSEEEVKKDIEKYRTAQKTSQQVLGDITSAVAGMSVYSFISNLIKTESASNKLGASIASEMAEEIKRNKKLVPYVEFFQKMTKPKRIVLATTAAMLTGAIVKNIILKLDRIGSKEFKPEKKKDGQTKAERKSERKALNKAKRKENRKNFLTGALNCGLTPLIGISGGVVGVPVFIAANLFTRYMTSQKGEKEVSFGDFAEKLKDNAGLNIAAAALTAVPLAKRAKYNKVLSINLEKAVSKLRGKKLVQPFNTNKTAYMQIEDLLLGSDKIKKIMNNNELSVSEKIKQLTDENIFAVKFIQISDNFYDLGSALREDCPSTRTINEAKDFISKTYGKRFEVSKQLGVGTVAETYLAKDTTTGKEVCIKIIKDGITESKIDADKQKMVEIIKSAVKNPEEKKYLLDNIDDLASGIRKEVDLSNELEAAQKLAKCTKQAKVVRPIEIKDNIYIMEKAPGISLKTLQDIAGLESYKKYLKRQQNKGNKIEQRYFDDIDKEIAKIKAKSPDFDNVDITKNDIHKIMDNYIRMYTEQFDGIIRGGKTIHTDIHAGNVFIDIKALKQGKKDMLTLIDTGNTIDMSMEQAHNALKYNQYIANGNIKDLSKFIMEGAILPSGMTKEASVDMMEKELKKLFFDSETKIQHMNNNTFYILAANVMKKHNIIPSQIQASLDKARKSAAKSTEALMDAFLTAIEPEKRNAAAVAGVMKETAKVGKSYLLAYNVQQLKNMLQYGPKQIIRNKFNKNKLKTNSEEYLTYKFKQKIKADLLNIPDMVEV